MNILSILICSLIRNIEAEKNTQVAKHTLHIRLLFKFVLQFLELCEPILIRDRFLARCVDDVDNLEISFFYFIIVWHLKSHRRTSTRASL